MRTINKIIVHHTAGSKSETIVDVDKLHKKKDWDSGAGVAYAQRSATGWYIQYHYFIDRKGTITKTREENEIGWHAGNYLANQTGIGICVQGNFDTKERPSQVQAEALELLITTISKKYKLKASDIYPHRHFTKTNCFGLNLSNYWANQFMKPITVTVLGNTEYDWTQLKDWFRNQGLYNVLFTFKKVDINPVYTNYTTITKHIDEDWFDKNLAYLGEKSDIILWLIKDWQVNDAIGYGVPRQRLGQWRCYMSDGGYEDKNTMTLIDIKNGVLRTMAHEMCHLIYAACGLEDKTHELDYSGQQEKLLKDVDFSRFKHFIPEDGTRFFYLNNGKIEERIIYSSIANMFASGYNYWRRVFGFTETIPKP